jgi:serine/threonine protein kinase/Tol biopolymer transport system component
MSQERHRGQSEPRLHVVFGAFELDVRAGELRKHGVKIRLQEQPFRVLLMLLERPGEVVLREEIRKKLWPNDTIVEFAPSINAAIQRLRDALGDSADQPRYVETVARRGYRFIGELTREETVLEPHKPSAEEGVADPSDLTGHTISHYRVYEKLGRGGMGEVYRARDMKLRRDVALKVLPEEFAQDADRMARFEREAQVLASLNHPNIAQICGVEERALVMEWVPGESLKGPLPLETAVNYAKQIADALEAAHAKNIIHRDLKPANIMITPAGVVKVLDFGLAAMARSSDPSNPANSPTLTSSPTRAGMILGTPGYMSPEQVRGQVVDHRSDIFSLGIILYELLSGKRAFEGESPADMMTAILREDPPELTDSVPVGLRQIVHRCLDKKPEERFQSARDLAFALRSLSSSTGAAKIVAGPVSRHRWLLGAVIAIPTALAVVFAVLWFTRPQALDLASYHYTPFATDAETELNPSWSPDGKSIAYLKRIGRPYQLMLRALDAPVPVQLTKMPDGVDFLTGRAIWSPEGNRIFFIGRRPNRLWSVAIAGGEPQEVFPGTPVNAATLSGDGKTFALWQQIRQEKKIRSSLWISSPAGAPPRKYEPAFGIDVAYQNNSIRFSPNGTNIGLSFERNGGSEFWLFPWPEGHSAPRRLFSSRHLPEAPRFDWMPDSKHLLMAEQGSLWASDIESEILQRVTASPTGYDDHPAVSPDGHRMAFSTVHEDYDIVSVPLDGSALRPILATALNEFSPSWSLSGRMAFITDRSGQDEVWLRDAQGDLERPIATQSDFPDDPTELISNVAISPNGGRVAYVRLAGKSGGALWISPASGGRPASVPIPGHIPDGFSWSPDGNSLAVLGGFDGAQLAIVRIGSDRGPTFLGIACGAAPAWSPDGRRIACGVPSESAILLISPDGKESRRLLSPVRISANSLVMVWSRDSSTIYIASSLSDPARLDAIDVRTGAARKIADFGPDITFVVSRDFCVSGSLAPDGKSFATSVLKSPSDIWILDGFSPTKHRWFSR